MPTARRLLISKARMEERVVSILAGKAATEVVFGESDVGAYDDLRRAFDIVERFSDNYCSYGFEHWTDGETSSALKARREERIAADMDNLYARAKKILIENRAFLDGLAKRLQEKDTLVSSEIREIKARTAAKK